MLVVGDKEAQEGKVSVRRRGEGVIGEMTLGEFVQRAVEEIETRSLL